MESKMKVTLILAALLTFFANLAYTQEYELVLTEAVDAGSNGRFPLHVFMRADGDTFDDAVLWSIPREFSGTVDVSGLSLVDGVIQGTLAATINGQDIQAAITVHDQGAGILRGQYRDGERSPSLVRSVEGRVRSALDTSAPSRASLMLQHPSVGPVFLNIEHDGSGVQSVTLQTIRLRNTGYGSSFNPSQMAFINSDGVQAAQLGNIDALQPVAAVSHDLTLDADGLHGRVSLDLNPGGGSTRLHYDLETSMIAGYLFGNVTIRDAAENPVGVPQSAAGHIAAPQPALPTPELTPMVAAPAQAGTAFAPPYFENISQEAFANRVRAAALWLGQSSYVGAYHSDFFANLVTATGSKQYDNASENTYGAVMAHLMLARLSEDPAAREAALRAAQRAGHWGQALGIGPYNMLEPYKGLFYTTIGQGWAFLELYQQTGDAQWLANARRHADGLRELQVLMSDGIIEQVSGRGGNAIAGTWTYFTPAGGYAMGESDSRTNRTRDFEPIQCGQILIFLGRLRVESGIDDYLEMEQAAAHWMSANLEDDWTWETKPQAGYGPASYLYYLLHYAENPSEADIDQVLAHIETQHTSWAHNANTMSPGVAIDINRRQGVTDLDASVSLRVALCYLELHTRRGDAVYLEKAKALILSALSRQNDFGYLSSGGWIFSDLAAADSFPARYAEDPNHPYTMYNALTVDLLHRCYQALARREAFADGAVVAADLTVDHMGGLAPLTVAFDASASTGSALTYHWDFGDGTQGSGATPGHQFSHPGNYLVQLTVRSGDVADHRSVTIRVREAQELTSIAVSPVERLYWQNPWDFNDSMEYLQVNEQRAYQAKAYDQYGTRLAIQPSFTWTTDGENTVSQDGHLQAQPLPGQTFIFQLEASAEVEGHSVSGAQPYRVLGHPDPSYQGFSVNFHTSGGGNSPVDHPAYTAGVIALDQWGNQGRNTWGGGSSFETTFSDNADSATLRLSSGRANAAGNAATSPPNADVLISSQRLFLRDEDGLTISDIPQSYRDVGYDLYVYSHNSAANAHSIRLQIGDGEAETVWLKGTGDAWDGLTYTPATAGSSAEALAGGFTNVVMRSGLSAETINIHASFGITAIQLVKLIDDRETPEVNVWPTPSVIGYGATLESVELIGGEASVDGTFAFKYPDLVPEPGTAPFLLVFTPSDIESYRPVESPVLVTVHPAAQLVFFSEPILEAVTGLPYLYEVSVGGTEEPNLSLTSGSLPSWLTLTAGAEPGMWNLSGTPVPGEADQAYVIELTANDGNDTATQSFTLRVWPEGSVLGSPQIRSRPLAELGPHSAEVRAELLGGDAPITLHLWLGASDGGDDPNAWDEVYDLGSVEIGEIAYTLTGLDEETTYFYRFFAENLIGQQSTGTETFETPKDLTGIFPQITLLSPASQVVYLPEGVGLIIETLVEETGGESGQVSLLWEATQGFGSVTWEEVNRADTVAWLSARGEYTLRLTADNGTHADTLELLVRVLDPDLMENPEPTDLSPLVDYDFSAENGEPAFVASGLTASAVTASNFSISFDGSGQDAEAGELFLDNNQSHTPNRYVSFTVETLDGSDLEVGGLALDLINLRIAQGRNSRFAIRTSLDNFSENIAFHWEHENGTVSEEPVTQIGIGQEYGVGYRQSKVSSFGA
jgi:PKD repeat protein